MQAQTQGKNKFLNALHDFFDYKFFFITLFLILLKSILFLGMITSVDASKINFIKSFYEVPPILVFICFITVFLSIGFLYKNTGHYISLLVINLLLSIFLEGDIMYYRGFGSFLSLHLLSETSNLDNLSSCVKSFIYPIDIVFFIDILIIILLMIFKRKLFKPVKKNVFIFISVFVFSIAYITFSHYRIDKMGFHLQKQMLFRTCWTPNQTISDLSPIGYQIYDLFTFYDDSHPYNLTSNDKTNIKKWYADNIEKNPVDKNSGLFKGKNLLIIQWESLENFVVNKEVQGQELTPNLNKFIKNSFYFNHYHEQVYNGTSSDSDLMTNNSIFPIRNGSTFFRFPDNTYNSLPKILESEGYTTYAIHPDKGAYWNWMPNLKSYGFQHLYDSSRYNCSEIIGLGISDGSYFNQIEPIIKNAKTPFYSFVVTLSSHAPFDLPNQYRTLKLSSDLDSSRIGGYFQSIHYTDEQFGKFMNKLEADGVLNNTAVAIYGDHCGVHKYYQSDIDNMTKKEDWWVDDHKEIPLVIYNKDLKGEQIISKNAGQVDVMPTLLYLLGVDKQKYENTVMGKNIFTSKKDYALLEDGSIVGNQPTGNELVHEKDSLNIADLIIKGSYYGKFSNKK